MNSEPIVIDTYYLAIAEDREAWEDRFDLLVNELTKDYGPHFYWSTRVPEVATDIVFVLYPPNQHPRIVHEKILEKYVLDRIRSATMIQLIVIGFDSNDCTVTDSDVFDIVNAQCLPNGIKATAFRVYQPEGLDDSVKSELVRLHSRRCGGAPMLNSELEMTEPTTLTNNVYSPHPAYGSFDL